MGSDSAPLARTYDVVFFDIGDTLVSDSGEWLPGALDTLLDLRNAGYRLGLISNTGSMTRQQLLQQLPPDFDLGLFDPELIVLSSEVGVEKPAPGIFRYAISCAGGSSALFCTETLLHALAAQAAGLAAARLQPPPQSDVGDLPATLTQLVQSLV